MLPEVGGDAAGNLVQIGGSHEQAGQMVQLSSRQPVQGASDIDLGRIPQQDHDQVAIPAVAAVQPDPAPLGRLLVIQLARVVHQAHLLLLARVRRNRERRRMRARPLGWWRSS
jgi:hypothetical protein